jgi:hypothetical protein
MDINKIIKKEILDASELISDRGEDYGNAISNHKDICDLNNVLLRDKLHTDLTEIDVVINIIAIKMARLMKSPNHLDSWRDIINYCGIAIAINKHHEKQDDIVKNIARQGFNGDYKEQMNGSNIKP